MILFYQDGGQTEVWKGQVPVDAIDVNGDPLLKHYFLNNADDEGVSVLGYVAFKPDGQTPIGEPEFRETDGDDAIFGDLGNDWIVGGTGRDRTYGGFGNDLLQADDVLGGPGSAYDDTNGLNDAPDTHLVWEDRAFGGAGLDVLIGNTKGDRLIDWIGEFNSYIVPFAPFGVATVSRQVPPQLFDFLYAQAFGDGADITRNTDTGTQNSTERYSNVTFMQGGIDGEIGLVTQQDHGYWQDQTGGPSDPQAGNIPGGRRDVLRTSDFNNASMDLFVRDTGNFSVTQGRLRFSADAGTLAAAVYNLDAYLPVYYEIRAMLSADKPLGTSKANAYIIFDYQSDVDFKWAGINISTNKIEMGYRDQTGWHQVVQSNKPVQLKPGAQYDVLVAVNGVNVTVSVAGVNWFTYDFTPRLDEDGNPIPLNKGFVGIASDSGSGTVDNFTVQVLPPDYTLDTTDTFDGADALMFTGAQTGTWTLASGMYQGTAPVGEFALSIADPGARLQTSSILELETTLMPGGVGGFVFDYYDTDDFKFVAIDAASDQVIVGHVSPKGGLSIDKTFARTLSDTSASTLRLTFSGASVSITAGGGFVGTYAFNSALVDGGFGLLSLGTMSSFDEFTIRTNEDAFGTSSSLVAATAAVGTVPSGAALTQADVDALLAAATSIWTQTGALSAAQLVRLEDANVALADLDGQQLGFNGYGTIYIDRDAAGHGWFVDSTPQTAEEFSPAGDGVFVAIQGSSADGRMDLLTVLLHELGHMAELAHSDHGDQTGLMSETLGISERRLPVAESDSHGDSTAAVFSSPLPAPPIWFVDIVPVAKQRQFSFELSDSGTGPDRADLLSVILSEVPGEIDLANLVGDDDPTWSELTGATERKLPNLGRATIDTDSTGFFDEATGQFVNAEEFRLLRFAGLSQAQLDHKDEFLVVEEQQSASDAEAPAPADAAAQSPEKLAGLIEWEAHSSLLSRLATLFDRHSST